MQPTTTIAAWARARVRECTPARHETDRLEALRLAVLLDPDLQAGEQAELAGDTKTAWQHYTAFLDAVKQLWNDPYVPPIE